MAATFTPQGSIDLKNVFNITNVPYINGINFTAFYNSFISSNSTANARIDSVNSSLQTQIGRIDNINSTITNNNASWSSTYNSTYATYAYNQTTAAINDVNSRFWNKTQSYNKTEIDANNASWSSTYNATYAPWAYNQTTSAINDVNSRFWNRTQSYNNTEIDSKIINNGSYFSTYNTTYANYVTANVSNSTSWWAQISGYVSGWFSKNGNNLDFNETKLNNSIADNPKNWTSLQNYPVGCPADTFITNISDSTTCSSVSASNSSSFWAGVSSFLSKWFYNSGNVLNLNETQLNLTIQSNINGNLTDYYKKSQTYNNTANINAGNYNLNITNITIGGHIIWENASGALIID